MSTFELKNKVVRLQRPQLRVWMDFMGIPYHKHPNRVKDLRTKAKELCDSDPIKANDSWERVTGKKSSTSLGNVTAEQIAEKAVEEACKKFQATANDISKAVEESLQSDIAEKLRKEFTGLTEKYRRVEIKAGTSKVKKMKDILPPEFDTMVKYGQVGQNILLVGPSGSGKTFLSHKLAEALGRPFASQSCSAGMSESQLAGWLLPIGKTGQFTYVPSQFVEMYEKGGVFLFDEMDAADENTLIFVNAALAGDSFYLPQRFNKPQVKRHKNFVAVAAANTFGHGEDLMYSGRNRLDGATLDRFRAGVIFLDYSDVVEEALVDPEVLAWGRKIRSVISHHRLERIMSTRVLLDFTKQKQVLQNTKEDWERTYFHDWSAEERRLVERS